MDLRKLAATPDALKTYLEDHYSCSSLPSNVLIQTEQFPRGCMQILLDHLGDTHVTEFQNHYGSVYKHQLQNPDLKLLVKTQGKWLTHLRMTPLLLSEGKCESRSPKLQGCGYRWITLHAKNLQVLELSLRYDVKQQMLDFSRRTPLQVEQLKELTLRDVGSNTTREQLVELVTRAKVLEKLILRNVEFLEEDDVDLGSFLKAAAKKAGNAALDVSVDAI